MSEKPDTTQRSRLRSIRLVSTISLAFFAALLVWQLLVLINGSYPDHILPAVKILSGTQESVPIAYAWTIRLALITVAGLVASSIGWFAANLHLRKTRS